MSINEQGHIRWRFRRFQEQKRSAGYVRYSPSTKEWSKSFVKAVRKIDSTRSAAVGQARYIMNKDSHSIKEGKKDLVGTIGDPIAFAKKIGNDYDHYRIMISPERGDLLDMETFVVNVVREVENQIKEKIDYAAAIHKPERANSAGIYNQHVHLIMKGGFGRSQYWFRASFKEAAALEATRQIELGIGDNSKRLEITKELGINLRKHLEKKHD